MILRIGSIPKLQLRVTFISIKSYHFSDIVPIANQTEIIYSVFVDGRPVLATTAAEDMKLVSKDEASQIMEKIIYTKAERKNVFEKIWNRFQ